MFGIEKDFQKLMEQVYGPLDGGKMTEIEEVKAQIKVLEKKVALLEEIEKQPKTLFDVIRNLGYSVDACYEIVDAVEEFQKPKEYQPTPQTPEQVSFQAL